MFCDKQFHLPASPRATERHPRLDRVRAIRQAIAAGEYETEARWAITLDRVLEALQL